MVGWLGAAALAGIGGLVSQRNRWQQVPYLGAIAAVAMFVKWSFSRNRIDDEGEKQPDVASTDDLEIADEKLDRALEPGVPDEELELCTQENTEMILDPGELPDCDDFLLEEKRNICVPNGIVLVNRVELHPLDVQYDEAGIKVKECVNTPNFKDVTEDPLLSGSDSLNRERPLIETWILSAEAEERPATFAASRDASHPNPAEELGFHDAGVQVLPDVKNLAEVPESFLLSTVLHPQVDKNVDAIIESHVDAKSVISHHFSLLSVKPCKPNCSFEADCSNSPIDSEQKVRVETTKSPSNNSAGKNFEDEINLPQQEGCRTDEDGECRTPRCTSLVFELDPTDIAFSLGGSEDWRPVVDDVSSPQATEQAPPVREPCCVQSDDENVVQSPSAVKTLCVDTKGVGDELSNSARREYAERLCSYDEYLADPELSPTMRSQVLRARTSVAMYFDESDDDQ